MNASPIRRWNRTSVLVMFAAWLVLQIGCLFTPGLLDDVDSVYLEIAREMLQRHDYVTPMIDGFRFFDKPPLIYWLAAGSMKIFGVHDWAGRLPLALGMLALTLAVYALGIRLLAAISPEEAPDRGGLYAALGTLVALGPYLYTRFYIPDMLIALWMTLSVLLLLRMLDAVREGRSAFVPSLGFGAVMALDVLTKGLIGLVFPLGFTIVYLLWTGEWRRLFKLHPLASTAVFLLIAAPWHVLAALRNPPVAMPAGVGLPARAGWAWFYLYNEHIARFLQKRIPHDYGQVPIPLFWLLLALWCIPWTAFLPQAVWRAVESLRGRAPDFSAEAARVCLLWAGLILGFFTLSARQEYYHLPALPALALLIGGLLARADRIGPDAVVDSDVAADPAFGLHEVKRFDGSALVLRPVAGRRVAAAESASAAACRRGSAFFLLPLGCILAAVCGWFAISTPTAPGGADLAAALSSNPDLYNLSLGHVFDLTGKAMGFFHGPLWLVTAGMLLLGPAQHVLRRRRSRYLANLVLTAGMTVVLLGAHGGLATFYPILGSKGIAEQVNALRGPNDLVMIDGELTSGSTLLFYTGQPVLLVNGRVNGPWFGSLWPDAPNLFPTDEQLRKIWAGDRRVFLMTYNAPARMEDLRSVGPVYALPSLGGKTLLTNRRLR